MAGGEGASARVLEFSPSTLHDRHAMTSCLTHPRRDSRRAALIANCVSISDGDRKRAR